MKIKEKNTRIELTVSYMYFKDDEVQDDEVIEAPPPLRSLVTEEGDDSAKIDDSLDRKQTSSKSTFFNSKRMDTVRSVSIAEIDISKNETFRRGSKTGDDEFDF